MSVAFKIIVLLGLVIISHAAITSTPANTVTISSDFIVNYEISGSNIIFMITTTYTGWISRGFGSGMSDADCI